jgi:muramoyltetrapeptide carboxypeptidase
VAVVAPAGPVPADLLERGIGHLRSWGLDVVCGEHVLDRHLTLPYLAGTDADRAADLRRAWCDPDVAAVFCARGGYGCLRTIEHLGTLDDLRAAGPTTFVGSSDITALHALLGAHLDLVTYFGPMVATAAFVDVEPNREHLRRTLFDPASVAVLRGPHAHTLVPGTATGPLVGGNLSLIVSGIGVPALQPPHGAIAVIEDVNEDPYRIDHFLTHLLRTQWFDNIAGIALGSWHDCGTPDTVLDVVTDRLTPLGIPLVHDLGFGHGPHQLTLPLRAQATLDAHTPTLTIHPAPPIAPGQ